MITPSALGLLLPAFPPEKRTQIVSLWGGMGALGVVAGPTVGALLIEHFGWRAAFYVNVPVCSIALVGGWFILTETPRQVCAHRPDFIGAAMITLSLASLALAISEGNRHQHNGPACRRSDRRRDACGRHRRWRAGVVRLPSRVGTGAARHRRLDVVLITHQCETAVRAERP